MDLMMIKYNKLQLSTIASHLFEHNLGLREAIKAQSAADVSNYLLSTLQAYKEHPQLPAWLATAGVIFNFNKEPDGYLVNLSIGTQAMPDEAA